MRNYLYSFYAFIRREIGVSELFFIFGMILLYCGLSALHTTALAQTACGVILVLFAWLLSK